MKEYKCKKCEYRNRCALNVAAEYDAWERKVEECNGSQEDKEKWDDQLKSNTLNID